ncbi:S-adenosyl-L-methionine:benzoic acid/salicylic acid carboxyl methyltransferase 3 [Ricinus communis]|nr:S-adenosyl-L-methionine:benzoic acid/salicylic acid carboxyl methyltransferase 3 [Ricinus communis]
MGLEEILHMNGGTGKTSYASNSNIQKTAILMAKPILEESLLEFYCTKLPDCLRMADFGCSSGPNTFLAISQVVDIIESASQKLNRPPASLQAFLNDLPGNDFNTVFRSLPSFYKKLKGEKGSKFAACFVAGVPGSFYDRLFPDNSLHFVHSSYALMWISEAPKILNKENIYIAKTSPPAVFNSYLDQFQKDFTMFLKNRSEELIAGGCMVLTTMGSIRSDDPLCIWEVVGSKLHDMVLEGLIKKEKMESFNLPYYAPTTEEIKKVIDAEGSFTLQRLEVFKMDWDAYIKKAKPGADKKARAAIIATDLRAVGEPILGSHFGSEIMDDLFHRFEEVVLDHMEINKCQFINLVISLTKKA